MVCRRRAIEPQKPEAFFPSNFFFFLPISPFRPFTLFGVLCLSPLSFTISVSLPRVSFLEPLEPLPAVPEKYARAIRVVWEVATVGGEGKGMICARRLSRQTYIFSHLVVKSNKVSGGKRNCTEKYANGNGGSHLSAERSHFSRCLPLVD